MSRTATAQWANPDSRAKLLKAKERHDRARRITFDKLTEASFRETKPDGRVFARYRDENNKEHAIYRYQWRWQKAYGPVPEGYVIHHKDHDCTNDALKNLELKTWAAHTRDHVLERGHSRPKWTCQHCGTQFEEYARGNEPRKYCSKECHYASRRGKSIAAGKEASA